MKPKTCFSSTTKFCSIWGAGNVLPEHDCFKSAKEGNLHEELEDVATEEPPEPSLKSVEGPTSAAEAECFSSPCTVTQEPDSGFKQEKELSHEYYLKELDLSGSFDVPVLLEPHQGPFETGDLSLAIASGQSSGVPLLVPSS
jgi:hypothetical protein